MSLQQAIVDAQTDIDRGAIDARDNLDDWKATVDQIQSRMADPDSRDPLTADQFVQRLGQMMLRNQRQMARAIKHTVNIATQLADPT
ncbi:MAG TPA: hypothetical protein VJM33_11110 [Microthrixaceae bacterium]|nr:hypothetical protein [Microthrixaceae bacterium]